MVSGSEMIAIPGSYRPPLKGAIELRKSDPAQRIKVSIYARRNPHRASKVEALISELNGQPPAKRRYPSRDEFSAMFGADPEDLKAIVKWAQANKLSVLDESVRTRRVLVEGTVADVNAAFGVQLVDYLHPHQYHYRGREGAVHVPAALFGVIEGVFGLDSRRVGRPRRRRGPMSTVAWEALRQPEVAPNRRAKATPTNPWPGTFFPPQLAQLYGYPPQLTGSGQNVAILSFNGAPDGNPHGGYNLSALNTYFEQVLGGTTPQITDVVVMGPGNDPGPDTQASDQQGDSTGEVMLDVCVVGSVVPQAHIFMYFTEFTTQGWVDAIQEAITGDNDVSVISISYGNPENDPQGAWTAMGVKVVNQAFQAAAAAGITICCASGDDGSSDGVAAGAHVDFPASSPYVLGVGGTKLVASTLSPPKIASEVVWNEAAHGEGAGGGGISVVFTKPSWQDSVNVPPAVNPPHQVGRGVPDVAADADPLSGVVVMHIDGKHLEPIGGTSASTPLWASLIARLNQGLKARCGFINPTLYATCATGVLRDITKGNNGAYAACTGWDACTGLGTPQGQRLLSALAGGSTSSRKRAAPKQRRARR